MLLREYNEQAHIDSEKQISMEEGEKRIERLIVLLTEQGRTDDIIKFATDEEYKKKLFEEFQL